uniref:Uncharacterized protein n=1 Tax=Oryza rufipogon TaxID=4529 RepID=A0A0E0Q9P9_ORYRU
MVLKEQEESSTAFVESPLYPADKAGSKPRHVLVASSGFSVNASAYFGWLFRPVLSLASN